MIDSRGLFLDDRAASVARALSVRAAAFDRLGAMVALLDGSGLILDTNEAWRLFARLNDGSASTTGPTVNYLEVCDRAAVNGSCTASVVAAGLREVLAGEREQFALDYLCPSPTEDRWFRIQAWSAPIADGAGLFVFHVDITGRKEQFDRLAALASGDELTGLPTRRSAVEFLDVQLADASERGEAVWVLLFDIDDFTSVNDLHGQHVGDELLVKIAHRARRAVRTSDRLFRFGGSEFVVVCPGGTQDGAARLASRLRAVMAEPFQVGALELRISISAGFASSAQAFTIESLICSADAEMYVDRQRNHHHETAGSLTTTGRPNVAGATRSGSAGEELGIGSFVAAFAAAQARADAVDAHSGDLALFFRPDGTIESAGATCWQLFGIEAEALVGVNGMDLIHPDDQERVFNEFGSIPDLGDWISTRFRVNHPSGRTLWVDEIVTNLVDDPNVGSIVANLRDVTEHVRAEEAVAFQARLLAAVGQSVIASDVDGLITYWNDASETMFGWTAEEATGEPLTSILPLDPRSPSTANELLLSGSISQSWSGELWVCAKDGGTVPVMLTHTPVYDGERRVGIIGVSTDISERIRSEQARALLSSIVLSTQDAIFSAGVDGLVTTWNDGASALFGYAAAEITGRHISTVFPLGAPGTGSDTNDAALLRVFEEAVRGRIVDAVDARCVTGDGRTVHVSISVAPIRSDAGRVIGTCTIARDVTERVALLETLEAERRRLVVAQESAKLGGFELNLDTLELTRSDELSRMLGLVPGAAPAEELEFVHPDDRHIIRQALVDAVAGLADGDYTYRVIRTDGELRWVHTQASRLPGASSHLIVGTVLDITDRHEAQLALAYRATHDGLTQLPNAVSLHESLERILSDSDDQCLVAVAVVDLDHFKQVNDRAGHTTGDVMLQRIADRLRCGMHPTDIVARVGGDGFVLVRTGVRTLADARALASDANALLSPAVDVGGRELRLTASIGVALSTPADSPASLIRDADNAMHQAKHDGRNQITVFDHLARARAERRQQIVDALPGALADGEFRLEYQPVVDLSSREIAGFEALLRWTQPELGTIAPDEFIPLAESTGLILGIGTWVFDTALGQLAAWHGDARVSPDLWMAINVSASQLTQPDLANHVSTAIERAGIPASAVHLEITESVLMDRVDKAMPTLIELATIGVQLSIDDFGTGYSSLSYLSRLPVDVIKIDRSFVNGLIGTGHGTSIVRIIIALAETLSLDVVAEGIEHTEQAETLNGLGCRYGQGFMWSPSLPPTAALQWMLDRNAPATLVPT